eukprot:gene2431-3209_t
MYLVCCTDFRSEYVVDGSQTSSEFDGHGGLSAGGSSRLLKDYDPQRRSEILDYLFKPGFGAELGVLKVEIGGDTQSTDGTEASHQHSRGDLNCERGYEGWLAAEAVARNPKVKVWSLSWGVPHWIGNGSYFTPDNIDYQINWLKCLRDTWNVSPSYLGLWNERPQGSTDYVVELRRERDKAGFGGVGITSENSWQPRANKVLSNATFNSSIAAVTKHYPCNDTNTAALQAHKKFWAGEDTPTNQTDWAAASCWGRKLSQHWVKINATSVVSWSLTWSVPPSASLEFYGNAILTATEPWSGHYQQGLPTPPETFTLIVETLQ